MNDFLGQATFLLGYGALNPISLALIAGLSHRQRAAAAGKDTKREFLPDGTALFFWAISVAVSLLMAVAMPSYGAGSVFESRVVGVWIVSWWGTLLGLPVIIVSRLLGLTEGD